VESLRPICLPSAGGRRRRRRRRRRCERRGEERRGEERRAELKWPALISRMSLAVCGGGRLRQAALLLGRRLSQCAGRPHFRVLAADRWAAKEEEAAAAAASIGGRSKWRRQVNWRRPLVGCHCDRKARCSAGQPTQAGGLLLFAARVQIERNLRAAPSPVSLSLSLRPSCGCCFKLAKLAPSDCSERPALFH